MSPASLPHQTLDKTPRGLIRFVTEYGPNRRGRDRGREGVNSQTKKRLGRKKGESDGSLEHPGGISPRRHYVSEPRFVTPHRSSGPIM
ncbi:hypothetical protein Bpfe_027931 [Biomphalaria pfeifferi]|uniref:Uncharacterized protein n=1 Tax=Biomphalaria pfeifferi TaxID=112525 RepID=A0AAD8EX29_BIOPF|nr:hypothetical protein Bpfe_027931 [Biomphalaria pfeifferi]